MSIEIHNLYKGDMGFEDWAGFASMWLETGCTDFPPCGSSDLDGDKAVDFSDLEVFLSNWISAM